AAAAAAALAAAQPPRPARDLGPFSRAHLKPSPFMSGAEAAAAGAGAAFPGQQQLQQQHYHHPLFGAPTAPLPGYYGSFCAPPPPPPPKGLAAIELLTGLEEIDLEVAETALLGPDAPPDAPRARDALRTLPALRSVALCLHTERQAFGLDALGQELVAWLTPMPSGWGDLRVAVKGQGASGGPQSLVSGRLSAALPRCRFGAA
ncbi:hypothetical protein MNEG_10944, partial [Monoraphidium neglectum]